ncbi:hypothetical protein [Streptomyces sp. NBC_01198]|uniref:hypothetical protein n=1 Tax=Streptomyces sp. NBC_01198 TaxID=2903769 RepID=UPI002E12C5D7|nr:hypothetical protein OG702_33145 [Streptomyces sp. NBC_01198]
MPKNPASLSRPGAAPAPAAHAAGTARAAGPGRRPGHAAVGPGRSGGAYREAYRRAVDDRLDTSTSEQDLCRKAQFVDYESMRAMFEAWNARMWRGAGTLPSALPHPPLHTPVWPVLGHGLDVTGGYYGARKGCEPLHVQADPADGTVLAANHTGAAVRGASIAAQLYDLGGRPIGAPARQAADLPAGSVTAAFAVPFARSLPATHLLRLRLTGADGRLLSANDYWRYRTPTDMRSLNGLPNVALAVTARPAGQTAVTAAVANTGASPAAMVRLSLAAPAPGGALPPSLADDNCLWLLPGESRDIVLRWAAGARVEGSPAVVAQAYNALPVTA